MKRISGLLLVLVLVGFTGCGDKNKAAGDKAIQEARQSFDKAPAELKARYQAVLAAIQSNELAKAKSDLEQLMHATLTPEQQTAVAEQQRELMVKLAIAAQGGDANAGKMIQDLRGRSRSR